MHAALSARLETGELEITGRLVQASNVTLLANLTAPESDAVECVYKPIKGERPLWDFPDGTLALREVAAYEVSRAGGFDLVPVTILVDGPLGPGSLQAWVDIDADSDDELIDLVPLESLPRDGWFTCVEGFGVDDTPIAVVHADHDRLRMMAAFDVLINNADRKGGHILASQGSVFGVDHGISFHAEPKLRTLLWGWAGTELGDAELACVERAATEAPPLLRKLLAEEEVEAFLDRAARLIRTRRFPRPRLNDHRTVPWPPF